MDCQVMISVEDKKLEEAKEKLTVMKSAVSAIIKWGTSTINLNEARVP